MFRRLMHSKQQHALVAAAFAYLCTLGNSAVADELPALDEAVSRFNERQIWDYYPKFDFDFDGCYPATPFDKNNNLSANPGLAATGSFEGQCRDGGWWNISNTIHRQLCNQRDEAEGRVRRCAHFFELYFEKDQVVLGSFAFGGHRHDVETVIVWTGRIDFWGGGNRQFVSHVSISAHGGYTTRHITETIHDRGHAYVVYHKDGGRTHSFRFANQGDRDRVEFIGNQGDFFAPNILSYYKAYKFWNDDEWDRYWQNVQYRNRLRDTSFGSASFKSRNDEVVLSEANAHIPNWDSFWTGFAFTSEDVRWTRNEELWSNYPSVRISLPE